MDSIYFKSHCLIVFYFLLSTTENYLFFSSKIIFWIILTKLGFPGGSDSEESTCKADQGSISGWEDPLEKEMATTPVFLPGQFHGQTSLAGCNPWGRKESDMTK